MVKYKDLFNNCLQIYNNPKSSPLAKTLAKRELDRMTRASLEHLAKTDYAAYKRKREQLAKFAPLGFYDPKNSTREGAASNYVRDCTEEQWSSVVNIKDLEV